MKFYIIAALISLTVSGVLTDIEINWNQVNSVIVTREPLITAPTAEINKNATNNIKSRIINGTAATSITQFPSQIGLLTSSHVKPGMFWCSGSIISPNWVLTAAHCLQNKGKGYLFVGCVDKSQMDDICQRIEINSPDYIVHESFNDQYLVNDIALLRIPQTLTLTEYVNIIALNTNPNITPGQDVVISGWGRTESGLTPNTLNYAHVKIISQSECEQSFVVDETQICHGVNDSKQSVCQGDSGGPMTMRVDGQISLVGLTSFGPANGCVNTVPRVFTRISAFLNWICEKTSNEVCPLNVPA